MNLRQTAEVSVIIATSAAHIVEDPRPVPTESLHGYWKQSRTRLKCWFAGLRAGHASFHGSTTTDEAQSRLVSLAREILVTEMLTRVWSSVLTAADRRQQTTHATATASNTYQGHLEARTEVLRLIADDGALPMDQQLSLDRFRRRIERWTDALLGPLLADYGVEDYVFDVARARDYSSQALRQTLSSTASAHVPLLIAGLTAAVPGESDGDRERMLLNRAIIRSILAAFPKDAFPVGGQDTSPATCPQHLSEADPPATARTSLPTQDGQTRRAGPGMSFTEIRSRIRGDRLSSD